MTDGAETSSMRAQLAQMRELFTNPERPIPEVIEPLSAASMDLLRKPDGTPIETEAFLVSDEGAQLLGKLLSELISDNLTHDFISAFRRANEALDHPDIPPTFISRLMQLGMTDGLAERVTQGLFTNNPTLKRLGQFIVRAKREGSNDGERNYRNIRIIMMNIIRAEALTGRYSEGTYEEFCHNLRYIQGRDHTLNLSARIEREKRITVSYPGEQLSS